MNFDIHAITPGGGGYVLTVHQDQKDDGPLHLISAAKLARLEECEAMMERMMGEPLDSAPAEGDLQSKSNEALRSCNMPDYRK